jgi:outer membrane receptor protein involved in Fe transport
VSSNNYNSFVVKLDHRLTKDTLSFQYVPRWDNNTVPFDGSDLGTFGSASRGSRALYGLSYTRILTAELISEMRFGLTRVTNDQNNSDAGQKVAAQLGISGLPSDPYLAGFPSIQVRGLVVLGDKADRPVDVSTNVWQWAETITWVKGAHQLKAGGQIVRNQNFAPYYNNARGSFTFLGNYTNLPFADFRLGLMESAARQVAAPRSYLFFNNYAVFLQDDYKASSRLTLNLGVRYEVATPMYDKYGRFSNFVPELGKIVISDGRTVPNLNDLAAAANLTAAWGWPATTDCPDRSCTRTTAIWRHASAWRGGP